MKIYVVETICDYLIQIGFSPSKEVAQKEADELNKFGGDYFVTEYQAANNGFCEFEEC